MSNWIDRFDRIPVEPQSTLEERCTEFASWFFGHDKRVKEAKKDAAFHVILGATVTVPMRWGNYRSNAAQRIIRLLGCRPDQVSVTVLPGSYRLVRR